MDFVEAMKGIAEKEARKVHMPELGIVTSIFPHTIESDKENYQCHVMIKSLDLELRNVQIATPCIGWVGIPNIGDLVLVTFINGDINAPVIIGRLYNDQDRPPPSKAEEVVYIPPFKHDTDVRRFYLEFPEGMIVRITDDEMDINAGETKIIVQRNGDVIIDSKANISIKAEGDTSIKSMGDISISASNINIETEKELNIKSGADMKINSDTAAEITSSSQMKVKAGANMEIKGAKVDIN
jgi:phage baseplate assembly protein gpV